MATVPLSGTNIRLLSGVPFSNDYKHTRWFDTVTQQTNYFVNKTAVHSMIDANFQRIEGKHFISVNKSIDQLWGVNYLMFQNAQYNNKWFYGFVTKLEYIQKNTTYVHFAIDVFQTWKFEMDFKPSYVIREHCPLWNSDGTPVKNTVDEGLNYGTEYETVMVEKTELNDGFKWLVIVTKSPIHIGATNDITPTVVGLPQPLTVYVSPFKDDDSVPPVFLAKYPDSGGFVATKPSKILAGLSKSEDAVNNVVSLYITDYIGIQNTFNYTDSLITFPDDGNDLEPTQFKYTDADSVQQTINLIYVKKVLDFKTMNDSKGDKYTGYRAVKESKLLMHPYTQLILDDFKGNRSTYKLEHINNARLEIMVKGSLGTSNYMSYGIKDYNFTSDGVNEWKNNVSDEYAVINSTPNDLPVISDMLSAYLQGNRNSLANQRATANFNGMASIAGSTVGSLSSLMQGNAGGVASGIVGTITGAGSTVLQLQGINAKIKDIDNTPPQITKMGSNTNYTIGNNFNGLFIIKKQIKEEYARKLEAFFNLYGYKVNEVKLPNFHTRHYWNYIQTASCTILGSFNQEDLNELKAIFDNGITLWHTDDVGNYSLDNHVIGGIATPAKKSILPYGDSKTYGAGDDGTGERGYPDLLQALIPSDTVLQRIARPGYTVAQMEPLIASDISNYTHVTDVLFNLGTNDVKPTDPLLDKETWKSRVLSIIDTLQNAFDCRVYLARVWRETHNGQLTVLNDEWIPEIVAVRNNVFLGIDERTFLPANTADGIHPNHNGYVITANEWNEVI